MSVVSVEELFPGRRGEDGIQRHLKHTRVFEVITDDPNDDEVTAGAGTGVPRNGDFHPNNPFAVMVRITADNSDEDPTHWLVVCEYDTELPRDQAREAGGYDSSGNAQEGGQGSSPGTPGSAIGREDDPRLRAPKWKIDYEQTQEIIKETPLGTPIVNSAGDPFDPPWMEEVSYPVITIQKNYDLSASILNLESQDEYVDSVNLDTWKGIEPGKVRIVGLSVEYDVENGIPFGRVTFRMKYNKKGWTRRLLDQGYTILGSTGNPNVRIDVPPGSGLFPTEPQLLNGSGGRLTPPNSPVYISFDTFTYKNFNPLGL